MRPPLGPGCSVSLGPTAGALSPRRGAAPAAVGLAMIAAGIDRVAKVNRAAALELLEEVREHATAELARLRSLH
jgi:hypothetical protein